MSLTSSMAIEDVPPATAEDEREVARFLYREARLIDAGRFDEWLALWADDACYWVPANADDIDPSRHVSLIYDDRNRLTERIYRLTHSDVHSQEPASRLTHLLSGIEVGTLSAEEYFAHCAVLIAEVRHNRQEIYGGRVEYRLRRGGGALAMVVKKVILARNDSPLGNLTFLL